MLGELRGHGIRAALALDQNLVRDAQLLRDGQHQVVVLVTLVDIDHDPVLAHLQRLAERRHTVRRLHAVARLQHAPPDRVVGDVADAALARSRAVDRPVVAKHQHTVLREFQVQLHDVHAHADHRFDGGDRVLGVVAPVAPVRSHDDVFGAGVVDFGDDRRSAVSGNRFGLRAGPEQGKAGEKDQQFFHF